MATQDFNYDDEDRLNDWKTDGNATQQLWDLSLVGDWNSTQRVGANPINENRQHTDVHEVNRINGQRLRYDFKGNLVRDRRSAFYTWDAENRLRRGIDLPERRGSGRRRGFGFLNLSIASYRYDALGRRVQKTVRQRRNRDVTTFVCAGAQVVTEYENGNESQSYVYASYVDEPIALIAANGTASYYHANHLFSVEAMTDAVGNLIETYDYDSYGAMTIRDGSGVELGESAVGNVYGFTGRRLDAESGLYYFRARYFDVELGRFITRDPLGYVDGSGLYNGYFVPNAVDPNGKKKWFVAKREGWHFNENYEWDEWFDTVIGEGGIVQGWEGSMKIDFADVDKDCNYNSFWVKASAKSHYWHSPLFGLFSTDDKADYSVEMLLRCDPDTGEMQVEEGEGTGTKGKAAYATATISAVTNGKSALVSVKTETGASADISSVEEFGLELPLGGEDNGPKLGFKVGTQVTKKGGYGKVKTKTLRYRCVCCEDGKPSK